MKKILLLSLFAVCAVVLGVKGQNNTQKSFIRAQSNSKNLEILQTQFARDYVSKRAQALKVAEEKGWPIEGYMEGSFYSLQELWPDGTPHYYIEHGKIDILQNPVNLSAARSTRADRLWTGEVWVYN